MSSIHICIHMYIHICVCLNTHIRKMLAQSILLPYTCVHVCVCVWMCDICMWYFHGIYPYETHNQMGLYYGLWGDQASKSRTASLTHLCVVWAQFVMCDAMCVAHPLLLQHCCWSSPVPTVQMWTHTFTNATPAKMPLFPHFTHVWCTHVRAPREHMSVWWAQLAPVALSLSIYLSHTPIPSPSPTTPSLLRCLWLESHVTSAHYSGVAQTRRPSSVAVCASCL